MNKKIVITTIILLVGGITAFLFPKNSGGGGSFPVYSATVCRCFGYEKHWVPDGGNWKYTCYGIPHSCMTEVFGDKSSKQETTIQANTIIQPIRVMNRALIESETGIRSLVTPDDFKEMLLQTEITLDVRGLTKSEAQKMAPDEIERSIRSFFGTPEDFDAYYAAVANPDENQIASVHFIDFSTQERARRYFESHYLEDGRILNKPLGDVSGMVEFDEWVKGGIAGFVQDDIIVEAAVAFEREGMSVAMIEELLTRVAERLGITDGDPRPLSDTIFYTDEVKASYGRGDALTSRDAVSLLNREDLWNIFSTSVDFGASVQDWKGMSIASNPGDAGMLMSSVKSEYVIYYNSMDRRHNFQIRLSQSVFRPPTLDAMKKGAGEEQAKSWQTLQLPLADYAIRLDSIKGSIAAAVGDTSLTISTFDEKSAVTGTQLEALARVIVPRVKMLQGKSRAERDASSSDVNYYTSEDTSSSSGIDSDGDGLSDSDERSIYGTARDRADTDGDGFPDGEEVLNGRSPLGNGVLAEELRTHALQTRSALQND